MSELQADIPCPHCRRSFSVPLAEMGPGRSRSCPNCGAAIRFAGDDAGKVQQAVDQLRRQFGDAAVEVKVKTRERHPWWKFWSA
jgi:hypothetical protein